jgi:hypothetical protein
MLKHVSSVFATTLELDGVADQVLEQLSQLPGVCLDCRQWIMSYYGTCLSHACLQVYKRPLKGCLCRNRLHVVSAAADTTEGQQILNHPLHSACAIDEPERHVGAT